MIQLPIDNFIKPILDTLRSQSNIVITAAPGAGKTTRVPPALLQLTSKKVILLQPRRLAAKAAAERISEELQTRLGEKIGYQVRFEKVSGPNTQLLVLTEALLLRRLIHDPDLSDVGVVVFDEFHERNIYSDISLAAIRELQLLSRPDLKIVVMSATLDAKNVADFLSTAPIIEVPGRLFPISIEYDKRSQLLICDHHFIQRFCEATKKIAHTQKPGRHILCFLPGLSEIQRCYDLLSPWATSTGFALHPLHGNMNLDNQSRVLTPSDSSKIILATNIAETSLTIDGVDTVIDSGLRRQVYYSLTSQANLLKTERISLASAQQRLGRAGRQFEGRCYRLWTKMDELSMKDYDQPEIFRSELSETLLFLAALGITNFNTFNWYERPTEQFINLAENFLYDVGALASGEVSNGGQTPMGLTAKGKKLLKFPLSPRLANIMLQFQSANIAQWGALICATLSERDFLSAPQIEQLSHHHSDSDIILRLERLLDSTHHSQQRIKRIAKELSSLTEASLDKLHKDTDLIHRTLLQALPFALCKRRRTGDLQALAVNQKGVELYPHSAVKKSILFLNAQGSQTDSATDVQVRLAIPVKKEWIIQDFKNECHKKSEVYYDKTKLGFYCREATHFKTLPLEDYHITPAHPKDVERELPLIIVKMWDDVIEKNIFLKEWIERYHFAKNQIPDLPPLDESWIHTASEMACLGEVKVEAVIEKDWIYFLNTHLKPDQLENLENRFPLYVNLPSGYRAKISYAQDEPTIEIKIQQAYGLKDTPAINRGANKLKLVLLGPNFRPLQVTKDIKSFWKTTYQELKGPLRARYPKHKWPDKPED